MITEGNILILTQWSFRDALVQTYTLPYVDIIRKLVADKKIIVVTSEQRQIALTKIESEAVNEEWNEKNMKLVNYRFYKFGLVKLITGFYQLINLFWIIKKEHISVVHAFCTPAGSMAYLLCKFSGVKLIIDSYEPHAEAMVENGTWKKSGIAFKLLFALEKRQTRLASALIATTEGIRQYALEKYGILVDNFYVKPACVDLVKFSAVDKNPILVKKYDLENKIVCVYAGKLGGIYFKGEVFDFIKACYDYWKDGFRFLMLTNVPQHEVIKEAEKAGIPTDVIICLFVSHRDVPGYLSIADFALNPVKPVPTKRFCTPIKDGEYWAMGLPVVISPGISDDSEIIAKEGIGVVLDFNRKEEFKNAIQNLEKLFPGKSDLRFKIRNIAEKYRSFEIANRVYAQIYSPG